MPGHHHLFIPGPTNVPERILRAMDRAMADHRSPDFPALLRGILDRLPAIVGSTAATPVVFPASGSGMWEAALTNTANPGDRFLAVRNGQFSHLFIDAARRLGYAVDVLEEPWGAGADPDRIEAALRADAAGAIRGVLVVHNETATGVTSDVAAVRAAIDAAGHEALLYVDGVSSIASLDFRMDAWGVDCAITGSQKGFMLPGGLGILYLSEKALARVDAAASPRAFFDLRPMLAQNADGYTPYTPALSLLWGLDESLAMLLDEGMANVAARHHRLAEGVRRAVAAWGLTPCAREPRWYSDTVTAVVVPDGIDSGAVVRAAYDPWQLSLGGGLSEVAGRVFRIGHLGDLNALMLAGALAGVEAALRASGVAVAPGSGVGAAMAWYEESARVADGAA